MRGRAYECQARCRCLEPPTGSGGTEKGAHRALEFPRTAAVPHNTRNLDHVIEGNVAIMQDVLLLHINRVANYKNKDAWTHGDYTC